MLPAPLKLAALRSKIETKTVSWRRQQYWPMSDKLFGTHDELGGERRRRDETSFETIFCDTLSADALPPLLPSLLLLSAVVVDVAVGGSGDVVAVVAVAVAGSLNSMIRTVSQLLSSSTT